MSYAVTLTNGKIYAVVPDGTINTNSSMILVGKNYDDYGGLLDDNFIRLLENASNETPPQSPIEGQLWWNSLNKTLNVFNGATFRTVGGAIPSPIAPPNPISGELWFDTTNSVLKVYDGTNWVLVGPATSSGTVTSITAGTGLTGGTITTSGTIGLSTATTSFIGGVIPDGKSISVTTNGVISVTGAGGTPTITSFSPTSGSTTGKTLVTINGTNFLDATQVTIAGVPASHFIVNSPSQIVAVSNISSVTSGPIVVTTDYGNATSTTNFSYVSEPTITAFSPISGSSLGGTAMTITGTNLLNATAVTVASVPVASFVAHSQSLITAITAAGNSTGQVSVITTAGTANSTSAFSYLDVPQVPTITSFAPSSGPIAGNTSVVITGTHFSGTLSVIIAGVVASSFTVDSATQITAITGSTSGITSGTIQVITEHGVAVSNAHYSYYITSLSPTISLITPTSGPTTGGVAVTIVGTNLSNVTAVSIAGVPAASVSVVSDTEIFVVTTASPPTAGYVVVTTSVGSVTSGMEFTYYVTPVHPTVTSFTPNIGSVSGGTQVIITGTNFTSTISVVIGGSSAAQYTINSDTQITAITAATPAGSGPITITNLAGSTTTASIFTYAAVPVISGFQPISGPLSGGTSVIVVGNDFSGVTSATVASANATNVVVVGEDILELTTTTNSAKTGPITATNSSGTGISTLNFTYTNSTSTGVTSVTAGVGLTGGTITSAGTIGLSTATTSAIGGVRPDGTTITVTSQGVISAVGGGGNYSNANVQSYMAIFTGQIAPTNTIIGIAGSPVNNWGPGFSGMTIGSTSYLLDYVNPANAAAKLTYVSTNYYAIDANNAYYETNGPASSVAQVNGIIELLTAPFGTTDSQITWNAPVIAMPDGYTILAGSASSSQPVQITSGGTLVAYIDNGGNYNTVSDTNIKENQQPLVYGLNEVANLVPKSFTLTTDANSDVHLGFIAQEVEDILPEIVREITATIPDPNDPLGPGTTDTKKSVAYHELIPVLVAAIQELKLRIEVLEAGGP